MTLRAATAFASRPARAGRSAASPPASRSSAERAATALVGVEQRVDLADRRLEPRQRCQRRAEVRRRALVEVADEPVARRLRDARGRPRAGARSSSPISGGVRRPAVECARRAAAQRRASSGISTSSKTTSWLAEARMPRWSHVSTIVMPGASAGTRNEPLRCPAGSSSVGRRPDDHPAQAVAAGGEDLAAEMIAATPSVGRDRAGRRDAAAGRRAELGLDAQRVDERRAVERRREHGTAHLVRDAIEVLRKQLDVDQVHDEHEGRRRIALRDLLDRPRGRLEAGTDAAQLGRDGQVAESRRPHGGDALVREGPVPVVALGVAGDLGRDLRRRRHDRVVASGRER